MFKLNDVVKIKDTGLCYPMYQTMASIMKLNNFNGSSYINNRQFVVTEDLYNKKGKIIAINNHLDFPNIILYGVELFKENGTQIIIEEAGIEFVN